MEGLPAIQGDLNPAAWMLEITTPGMEHQLGVDFAQVYKESDLARYTTLVNTCSVLLCLHARLQLSPAQAHSLVMEIVLKHFSLAAASASCAASFVLLLKVTTYRDHCCYLLCWTQPDSTAT